MNALFAFLWDISTVAGWCWMNVTPHRWCMTVSYTPFEPYHIGMYRACPKSRSPPRKIAIQRSSKNLWPVVEPPPTCMCASQLRYVEIIIPNPWRIHGIYMLTWLGYIDGKIWDPWHTIYSIPLGSFMGNTRSPGLNLKRCDCGSTIIHSNKILQDFGFHWGHWPNCSRVQTQTDTQNGVWPGSKWPTVIGKMMMKYCWLVVEPYPSEKWWTESQLGWWLYMEK